MSVPESGTDHLSESPSVNQLNSGNFDPNYGQTDYSQFNNQWMSSNYQTPQDSGGNYYNNFDSSAYYYHSPPHQQEMNLPNSSSDPTSSPMCQNYNDGYYNQQLFNSQQQCYYGGASNEMSFPSYYNYNESEVGYQRSGDHQQVDDEFKLNISSQNMKPVQLNTDLIKNIQSDSSYKILRCEHCHFKTLEKNHFLNHLQHHDPNRSTCCDKCNWRFESSADMKLHCRRIHLNIGSYKCNFQDCTRHFLLKGTLNEHMMLAHNMCSAENCNQVFDTSDNAMIHMKMVHGLSNKRGRPSTRLPKKKTIKQQQQQHQQNDLNPQHQISHLQTHSSAASLEDTSSKSEDFYYEIHHNDELNINSFKPTAY